MENLCRFLFSLFETYFSHLCLSFTHLLTHTYSPYPVAFSFFCVSFFNSQNKPDEFSIETENGKKAFFLF